MPKIIETRLVEKFREKPFFSRKELYEFYQQLEPDLSAGTFGWRIYDLKKKNIIKPLGKNIYTLRHKPEYDPDLSKEEKTISKKIGARFKENKFSIWATNWLNEFSIHQSGKNILIVEIEKEFVQSLYYFLKDNIQRDIFLNPDKKVMEFYVAESNNPLVIKPLVSRSPLIIRKENNTEFFIPRLEKILIDIYADDKLFYFCRGSELIHIYENAFEKYTINFTKLFGYAKRRQKEEQIKTFLIRNINYSLIDLIND